MGSAGWPSGMTRRKRRQLLRRASSRRCGSGTEVRVVGGRNHKLRRAGSL